MSVFVPDGTITSALTHFALYGLCAIIEHETNSSVRLKWTDESNPKPQLCARIDPGEIANAVRRHATRCASPQSWLAVTVENEGRHTAALSPRIATPSTPTAWRRLQSARHNGLDETVAQSDDLGVRMIGALGEPAYWPTDRNADAGASRWEMKTRNRGDEFIGGRLTPLAKAVAARTADEILSGLTGQTIDDEVGRNKPESRSGTGLTRLGPVDNALAWCALWGISQFPVIHRNGAQSGTAGTYVPPRRAYPDFVFLPVPTQPITLPRLRTILASRQLLSAATPAQTTDLVKTIAADAARKWLIERSIRVLMSFPVWVSANTNAPERRILEGSVVSLLESR